MLAVARVKVKGQFYADNRNASVHFCSFIKNNAVVCARVCVQACLKNWVVFERMNIHDHVLNRKVSFTCYKCKQKFYNELYRGI